MQYDDVIINPRWRTDAILKIVFGYISAPHWPINAKFGSKMKNHTQIYGSCDQKAIFIKSRWRTAAILKTALSLYLSRELSDFDQTWYADAYFHSEDGHLTKGRNFANSRWRTDAILKIVFGYILAPYWPINAKFGKEMKNHAQI